MLLRARGSWKRVFTAVIIGWFIFNLRIVHKFQNLIVMIDEANGWDSGDSTEEYFVVQPAAQNAIYSSNSNVQKLQHDSIKSSLSSICPELAAASKHILKNRHRRTTSLSVAMVQLVGQWKEEGNAKTATEVMHTVYKHNSRIACRHGYQTVAVTEPPTFFGSTKNAVPPPPYWKMQAILEVCMSQKESWPPPDLAWFLDGDIVVMDPFVRVEALWDYHSRWQQQQTRTQQLDILVAQDMNGINTGTFLVNCTSTTARQLLEMFTLLSTSPRMMSTDDDSMGVDSTLYEQNTMHYLLDTLQWHGLPRNESESIGVYDDGTTPRQFSIQQLRTRIRTTLQSCSLMVLPWRDHECGDDEGGPLWYEHGHFAVHTAGMRNIQERLVQLQRYLIEAEQEVPVLEQEGDEVVMNLYEAARLYLQRQQSIRAARSADGIKPCKKLFEV